MKLNYIIYYLIIGKLSLNNLSGPISEPDPLINLEENIPLYIKKPFGKQFFSNEIQNLNLYKFKNIF